VHKGTASRVRRCQNGFYADTRDCGENHMLFIVGVILLLVAVVIIPRLRVPDGVKAAPLGSMSEQWLAEHRAAHSA